MSRPLLVALLSLVVPVVVAQNSSFCGDPYQTLCKSDNHTACITYFNKVKTYTGPFWEVDMTDALKQFILEKHNGCRNTLASGTLKNKLNETFLPAVKMPTMVWSDLLQYFAQSNCNTCNYGHSQCRKSPEFPYAGENVGLITAGNDMSNFGTILDLFWSEYKEASNADIVAYKKTTASIGHFTVMGNEKCGKVGCAGTKYLNSSNSTVLFITCAYSYTNISGGRVYTNGTTPASACPNGATHPSYPFLCL